MQTIEPDWEVDSSVRALATTRRGGVSTGPWDSLNLGLHSGDEHECVLENRRRLRTLLPAEPCWLAQVHGTGVVNLAHWHAGVKADAAWTDQPGHVAVIQTADCLPLLIAHRSGDLVAAVHAGWRGLAGGVVKACIAALPARRQDLYAWIGPGICQACYQVGDEVRSALVDQDASAANAFRFDGERWRADLKAVAATQLMSLGVTVTDAGRCTHCESDHFYSFRRDGVTGRMASVIWLEY